MHKKPNRLSKHQFCFLVKFSIKKVAALLALWMISCSVRYSTPTNIALIKYWGKTDERLNLPLNSSFSISLDENFSTETSVEFSAQDQLELNGESMQLDYKIKKILNYFRTVSQNFSFVRIESRNSFPTAAGLASSASGYACLALCLNDLFEVNLSRRELSVLIRSVSGSACRSVYGGFVEWSTFSDFKSNSELIEDLNSKSHAAPFEHEWSELCAFVCIVSAERKKTGSTEGMRISRESSHLLAKRLENIDWKIEQLKNSIKLKNFAQFSQIVMRDSNEFHAICLDSYPPLIYLNDKSREIIDKCHEMNFGGNICAYTFDAGPNAVVFCLETNTSKVEEVLRDICPTRRVKLGAEPRRVNGQSQ